MRRFAAVLITASAYLTVFASPTFAQVRGVYPLGMSATNSGVTPEAGFSYGNNFLFYARDEEKGPNGEVVATGQNSVIMDMNGFIWVSKPLAWIPGKPAFSSSATLPFANNSLSSALNGAISGGGGFADSYYQPVILGWQTPRADIRAIYGFLAPTGRFVAGANDNVGNGYWTNVVASGQTIYITQNKKTAASAFEMYEWHTTQEDTGIHPGDTFDLDYSLTQLFPMRSDMLLQLGVVGYEQYQTTNKTGPNITPAEGGEYYVVHSLGFTTNVMLPPRKVNLGFRYFKEFEDRSTYQGYSIQIAFSVNF